MTTGVQKVDQKDDEEQKHQRSPSDSVVFGAGAAAAAVGLLLGGPFVAAAAAVAGAGAAAIGTGQVEHRFATANFDRMCFSIAMRHATELNHAIIISNWIYRSDRLPARQAS